MWSGPNSANNKKPTPVPREWAKRAIVWGPEGGPDHRRKPVSVPFPKIKKGCSPKRETSLIDYRHPGAPYADHAAYHSRLIIKSKLRALLILKLNVKYLGQPV